MKLFKSRKEEPRIEFASASETQKRARQIHLLVNVIVPDPTVQPWFVSDEASALDICSLEEDEIRRRLSGYFPQPIQLNLRLPLWQLVDALAQQFPGWPDEPAWENA